MDRIIELSEELKKELDSLPLFIEYKNIKSAYDNSEDIKELKKQIVRAKNENRMDDYQELLNKFHKHPLYLNFTRCEQEIREYLQEISAILNKK